MGGDQLSIVQNGSSMPLRQRRQPRATPGTNRWNEFRLGGCRRRLWLWDRPPSITRELRSQRSTPRIRTRSTSRRAKSRKLEAAVAWKAGPQGRKKSQEHASHFRGRRREVVHVQAPPETQGPLRTGGAFGQFRALRSAWAGGQPSHLSTMCAGEAPLGTVPFPESPQRWVRLPDSGGHRLHFGNWDSTKAKAHSISVWS